MIQLLVINEKSVTPGNIFASGCEFEITVSESPLHAFNRIIHISPDAIILNMEGDAMDGRQVLQRIRNMQASKEVPVLLCIAPSDEAEFRKITEADPNTDYLTIPVNHEEMFDWSVKALGAARDDLRKTVMVVDDDPVVLDLSRLYLGGKYKVITMNTAAETLSKLKISVPDIIMLDIAMPDMDGKELYKAIREVPFCDTVPILFQTGMAGIKTVRECVKLGAAGFVIKPIQKPVLLERIEETLNPPEAQVRKGVFIFEEFDFLFTLMNGYLRDDYDVKRGESVLQSLNHLEEFHPYCLIVDFDNSAYILNRIREKTEPLHIPIVLLSRDILSKGVMAETAKPNTYITQLPLTKESLIATIESIGEWRLL